MPPLDDGHRQRLGLVAELTARDVRAEARKADVSDIDGWWAGGAGSRITGRVAAGFQTSAALGVQYLAASALAGGLTLDPVAAVLDLTQLATSLRVTGPVAFKTNIATSRSRDAALQAMTVRLAGAAQRLALAGERETVARNIEASDVIIGYERVTAGGACEFCQMLAGRGAVYKTAATAGTVVGRRGKPRGNQRIGRSFHDHCRCTVRPIYATTQVTAGRSQQGPARAADVEEPTAPAGIPIPGPVVMLPPAPAEVVELRDLAAEADRLGDVVDRYNVSGAQGVTEILTLPDGRRFVTKEIRSYDGPEWAVVEADREELAAGVARAIGVDAPAVDRAGPTSLRLGYVNGQVSGAVSETDRAAAIDSEAGDRIGLFDYLIGNTDRNAGNWLVRPGGRPVAIDHGYAWNPAGLGPGEGFQDVEASNPFLRSVAEPGDPDDWAADLVLRDEVDWSPADLAAVRDRLEALRPEFDRLGRGEWLDVSLDRLGVLEGRAAASTTRSAL